MNRDGFNLPCHLEFSNLPAQETVKLTDDLIRYQYPGLQTVC